MSLASLRGQGRGHQLLAVVLRAVHARGADARRSRRENWRDKGVVFVGVDVQDLRGPALEFIKRFDIEYPIVSDGGPLVGRYGVTGYPETFFVDRRTAASSPPHIVGPATHADLNKGIRNAKRCKLREHELRRRRREARGRGGRARPRPRVRRARARERAASDAERARGRGSSARPATRRSTSRTRPSREQMKAYIRARHRGRARRSSEIIDEPRRAAEQPRRRDPRRPAASTASTCSRGCCRSSASRSARSRSPPPPGTGRATARRRRRRPRRRRRAGPPLDPELERRVDEELARFDA